MTKVSTKSSNETGSVLKSMWILFFAVALTDYASGGLSWVWTTLVAVLISSVTIAIHHITK